MVGQLASAVGEFQTAVECLRFDREQVCSPCQRSRQSHELAAALVGRGDDGDLAEAEDLLEEARNEARARGSEVLLSRVAAVAESLRKAKRGSTLPDRSRGEPGLSGREMEVLRCVANGYTNREIGELLDISTRTVDTYVARILQKTGTANRAEAAAFAAGTGLLERRQE
jgi:DNA-binding NarL/FixJ family response regulator